MNKEQLISAIRVIRSKGVEPIIVDGDKYYIIDRGSLKFVDALPEKTSDGDKLCDIAKDMWVKGLLNSGQYVSVYSSASCKPSDEVEAAWEMLKNYIDTNLSTVQKGGVL